MHLDSVGLPRKFEPKVAMWLLDTRYATKVTTQLIGTNFGPTFKDMQQIETKVMEDAGKKKNLLFCIEGQWKVVSPTNIGSAKLAS